MLLRLARFFSSMLSQFLKKLVALHFNPEITDELMVIYFDLKKEIFCITHES